MYSTLRFQHAALQVHALLLLFTYSLYVHYYCKLSFPQRTSHLIQSCETWTNVLNLLLNTYAAEWKLSMSVVRGLCNPISAGSSRFDALQRPWQVKPSITAAS